MVRQHFFAKQTLLVFFVSVLLLALPVFVMAAETIVGGSNSEKIVGGSNSPTGSSLNSFTLENPLNVSSFCGLVQKLLDAGWQLGVPIAMLFLVYSGFKFVVARGNPTKLQDAKKNFAYVLLGIAIYFGAWTLGIVVKNTINAISPGTISKCE
ncbi:MAG: hypothetical protein Q7S26_00435 [bacterium]|nr:hypothetical protein [bacterium]